PARLGCGRRSALVDRPFSLHARSHTPRSPTKLPSTLWAAAPWSVLGGPLICSRTCAESGSGGSSSQAPRAPARLGCGRRSALGGIRAADVDITCDLGPVGTSRSIARFEQFRYCSG